MVGRIFINVLVLLNVKFKSINADKTCSETMLYKKSIFTQNLFIYSILFNIGNIYIKYCDSIGRKNVPKYFVISLLLDETGT